MPTISPPRNSKSMPLRRITPWASCRQILLACNLTAPSVCPVLVARPMATLRPTMASANWSIDVSAMAKRATAAPPRITVTSSHSRMTSLSLCVIKIIVVPWPRSNCSTPNNCSVSCGVSTAVGSSRIKIRAPRYSALSISSRCWSPTGSSPTAMSSATFSPVEVISATRRWRTTALALLSSACGSAPSITFSMALSVSTSMKCWCTMPMPCAMASCAFAMLTWCPSMAMRPLSAK